MSQSLHRGKVSSVNFTSSLVSNMHGLRQPLFLTQSCHHWLCPLTRHSKQQTCKRITISCTTPPKKRAVRKPRGYWSDLENIRLELIAFHENESGASECIIPTSKELRIAGRRDLDNAISKMGGYHKVADVLGMKRSTGKRPAGYWKEFSNLETELHAFLNAHKDDVPVGSMPTQKILRKFKRSDIVEGIEQHGGTAKVAEKLGLAPRKATKSRHYWKDWAKVEDEVRSFVRERDSDPAYIEATKKRLTTSQYEVPRMPSQKELRIAGRADLAEAISDFHGGFREVAKRLGFASKKKDDFFYDSFFNLAREVYSFAAEAGQESVMPSTALLQSSGRSDLAAAIFKYNGMAEVAQRLGLQYCVRTRDAFKDWGVFRRNMTAFIERHGTPGELPSSRALNNFGRADLYQALLHHGGTREVADKMELKRNFWQDFSNVGKELLDFIAIHGTEGTMPTESEFLEVGRSSLNVAVSKFGYSQVARRLGLTEPLQSTQIALDTLLERSLSLWEYCESGDDICREDIVSQ